VTRLRKWCLLSRWLQLVRMNRRNIIITIIVCAAALIAIVMVTVTVDNCRRRRHNSTASWEAPCPVPRSVPYVCAVQSQCRFCIESRVASVRHCVRCAALRALLCVRPCVGVR
jgi:hypothetical protein